MQVFILQGAIWKGSSSIAAFFDLIHFFPRPQKLTFRIRKLKPIGDLLIILRCSIHLTPLNLRSMNPLCRLSANLFPVLYLLNYFQKDLKKIRWVCVPLGVGTDLKVVDQGLDELHQIINLLMVFRLNLFFMYRFQLFDLLVYLIKEWHDLEAYIGTDCVADSYHAVWL